MGDAMIRITCDNCERTLEVPESMGGGKYECPHCGDINRVPAAPDQGVDRAAGTASAAAPSASKRADKAAAAGYPPDDGPEVRVLKVRRCWFRSRAGRFLLVLAILVGGVAGLIWVAVGPEPWGWKILFWPMVVLPALVLAWWWVDRFSAALVVTTKRTTMHNGFFRRSTSEVVHDNIRNVQVDQTFWQRVWKVGKIGISSSGQDGVEVQVNHLPNPDRLRTIIDLYRPL